MPTVFLKAGEIISIYSENYLIYRIKFEKSKEKILDIISCSEIIEYAKIIIDRNKLTDDHILIESMLSRNSDEVYKIEHLLNGKAIFLKNGINIYLHIGHIVNYRYNNNFYAAGMWSVEVGLDLDHKYTINISSKTLEFTQQRININGYRDAINDAIKAIKDID